MHTGVFPFLRLFLLYKEERLTPPEGFMCGMIMERDELVSAVPGSIEESACMWKHGVFRRK